MTEHSLQSLPPPLLPLLLPLPLPPPLPETEGDSFRPQVIEFVVARIRRVPSTQLYWTSLEVHAALYLNYVQQVI